MRLFSSIKNKFTGGKKMNVIITPAILNDVKNQLNALNKDVARFEIGDFGWSGPIFNVVLDEQKENDIVTEIDGVKFAADNEIANLIKDIEIIKDEDQFIIKRSSCCG